VVTTECICVKFKIGDFTKIPREKSTWLKSEKITGILHEDVRAFLLLPMTQNSLKKPS
jgi:hypothetical protein